MLLNILIIMATIIFLLIIFIITASRRLGVVPMPSLPSERRRVSDILQDFPDIHKVSDLGSGWGGMARSLAHRHPERNVTALEKSIVPHTFSRLCSSVLQFSSVSCICSDILELRLNDNEAFITYLSGPVMKQLRSSFERDQPTGGVLISIAFAMPGWTPARVEYSSGLLHSTVYVYEL